MAKSIDRENPYPDDTAVLVWYPPLGANERDHEAWAWLPGSIVSQCGPDE